MNKGYGFLSSQTIGTLAVALLALFGTGACSRGERTVNATLSFPAAFKDVLSPGGSALVVFVRAEAVAAEEAGNPDAPILTSLQLPAAILQDPECVSSYIPKSDKSEKGLGFSTCTLNMPFPLPDGQDLEIRVRLFVSDPCPGCYGTALWTHVYYGSAIYYAEPIAEVPASSGTRGLVPSCLAPGGGDAEPGSNHCGIQLYDWSSANAPEGTGYGSVGGTLELATQSNPSEERCEARVSPVPAENATVVAYDAQTNVPLAIINANSTTLPSTSDPSDDSDNGEYNFNSLLPVGRQVRLYAHFTGGDGYSIQEGIFSFKDDAVYYSVGPDGFDVGSYVPVGDTSYPVDGSTPVTDADLNMSNCPARVPVAVRFFEQIGYPENPAAGLVPLPLGDVSDAADESLFGAANNASVDFIIQQCTSAAYFGCGNADAASLSIDIEHTVLFSAFASYTPANPFASFIGSKMFPTWTIPGLSFFGVPNNATTDIEVDGLVDPKDPGPALSLSSFSSTLSAFADAEGYGIPGVELFNAVLKPGTIANVDVIIHRPPPPTACGVDILNNILFLNHPYAREQRSLDAGIFHDTGIIASKDVKGGGAYSDIVSCSWYSGAGVSAPFNVPHYECQPSFSTLPESGTYDIAVRESSEFYGWGSAIATLDCGEVSPFSPDAVEQTLVRINPTTGVVTPVGPVPVLLDAIAAAPATAVAACAGKLYGADGKGGNAGFLYELDPLTGGIIDRIGPIQDATPTSYAVTGLALDPSDCTLYGTTGYYSPSTFLEIDTTDGSATVIGNLYDGSTNHVASDMTFIGTTLVGLSTNGDLLEIDPATATPTVLGSYEIDYEVGGFSLAAMGTTLFASVEGSAGKMHRLNATTAATMSALQLSGGTGCPINALTAIGPLLYGIENSAGSPYGYSFCSRYSSLPSDTDHALVSIDTDTGFVKRIGDLGVLFTNYPDGLAYAPDTAACTALSVADKLFAGDGQDSASSLYEVDITSGSISNVVPVVAPGPTPVGVGAMAFHPTTCVLYGVGMYDDNLYTINPLTGAATVVGLMGINSNVADLAFSTAGNLFGLTGNSGGTELVSINTASGAGSVLTASTPGGGSGSYPGGNGLEFVGTTLYSARNGTWGELDTLNPSTGAVTATDIFLFGGGSVNGCQIMALTNVNGTLYGIQKDGDCTPVSGGY